MKCKKCGKKMTFSWVMQYPSDFICFSCFNCEPTRHKKVTKDEVLALIFKKFIEEI